MYMYYMQFIAYMEQIFIEYSITDLQIVQNEVIVQLKY